MQTVEPRMMLAGNDGQLPSIEALRGFDSRELLAHGIVKLGNDRFARADERIIHARALRSKGETLTSAIRRELRSSLTDSFVSVSPLGGNDLYVLKTRPNTSDASVRTRLVGRKGLHKFTSMDANYIVWAHATVPNDPSFSSLWGLNNTGQSAGTADADIDAPEAWDRSTGNGSVVVGVIDTGIDYNHPDLAANMWKNPGETASNGVDDDGNGFVDDVYGYDFVGANDSDPMDDQYHGTHCAGTIGAVANNGVGVAGVAWNVKMMALKFLSASGSGQTADAIEAFNYVGKMRSMGINIQLTSNSWGGGGFSQPLLDAINDNAAKGIMVVASAGNNGVNADTSPSYPAAYDAPNIISVAATDRNDLLAGFSNYGLNSVDIGAPGVDVNSTSPGNSYRLLSGTSMAGPHVAGAAAMAYMASPSATWQQVRAAMLATVDKTTALNGKTASGGRLNLSSLLAAMGLQVSNVSPASGSVVSSALTSFTLTFDEAYVPASVNAAALTVNGKAASSVTLDSATKVTYRFATSPMTAEGTQTISLAGAGVKRAADNAESTPFTSSFFFDTSPLVVNATTPANNSVASAALDKIRMDFSEPIAPATVSAGDLTLSFGTVTGVTVIDSDTVEFRIGSLAREGSLLLSIAAGALTDATGNPFAGYSGRIELDFSSQPLPPFVEVEPKGLLVHSASVQGSVASGTDVDEFTVTLDRGQTLSLTLPVEAALKGSVEVLDAAGAVIASATSVAAGQAAVLNGATIATAGDYTIRIKSADGASSGAYTLAAHLNAAVEREDHGGPANDSPATAQDLTSTLASLGTGTRTAILGALGSGDADYYKITLAAGASINAVLNGVAGATLRLFDPSARQLAAGIGVTSGTSAINDFRAPVGGVYVLSVSGATGRYALHVSNGVALDAGATGTAAWGRRDVALGTTSGGSLGRLYAFDATNTRISEYSATTGALIRSFPSPVAASFAPDAGLATTPNGILVSGATGMLYELNPDTGATLRTMSTALSAISGLAFLNNEVFALSDSGGANIAVLDYATGTLKRTLTAAGALESLTGGGTVLLAGDGNNTILQINPQTGAVTTRGTVDNFGIEGLGVIGNELFVGTSSVLTAHDLTTLARKRVVSNVNDLEGVGADSSGNGSDEWTIQLGAGEAVTFTTATPGDGPGAFVNTLDPRLELRLANVVVASDENSAADGRNATFTYTATTAGLYTLRVLGTTGAGSEGTYVVQRTGGSPVLPNTFAVASSTPAAGDTVTSSPTTIRLNFSDLLDLSSLDAADLKINGVAASAFNVIDGDTVEFTPAAVIPNGTHTISVAAGSVFDRVGNNIAAFNATFGLSTGPRVVNSSVQQGDQIASGNVTFNFDFDQSLIAGNLDATDFTLIGGVSGSRTPASWTYDAALRRLALNYTALPDDTWTLTLLSANGRLEGTTGIDLDGEALAWPIPPNTSGNGTAGGNFVVGFSTDLTTRPFTTPLVSRGIGGAVVYSGVVTGALGTAADVDEFTIALDPNQTATVVLDPAAGLQGAIDLLDGTGSVVATAQATDTGRDVVLQTQAITAPGTYTMRVRSLAGAGSFALTLTLNAAVETENHNGATNDTAATAQNLDASRIDLAPGAWRAAVAGRLDANGTVRTDYFKLTLAAGETLSLYANGTGITRMRLLDANENFLAAGELSSGAVALDHLPITIAGTYLVVIDGTGLDYTLTAGGNLRFDNGLTPLWLAGHRSGAGTLPTSTALDDWEISLAAGATLNLITRTPGDGSGQFVNLLDPRLELLNASGAIVASNDNGAPDGRNAAITFNATTAGVYRVRVASANATAGMYVLNVQGATAAPREFNVTSITPAPDSALTISPAKVTVNFSQPVDPRSVQDGDLLLDGVGLPGGLITFVDGNTIDFAINGVLAEGAHTLSLRAGGITDVSGTPLTAFTSAFDLDIAGPRVISSSVQLNDVVNAGTATFTFGFDKALRWTNLNTADFQLTSTVLGSRAATLMTSDVALRTVSVTYNDLPEGSWNLTLISGTNAFESVSGNDLDGEALAWPIPANKSGNGVPGGNFVVPFTIDANSSPLPVFSSYAPSGSLAFESTVNGTLASATDADEYFANLDAGQTLSVVLESATLRGRLRVFDSAGAIVGEASASAVGGGVLVSTVPIVTAGTYRVAIDSPTGTAGSYVLRALLNGEYEPENFGGSQNDTIATAQDLSDSEMVLAPGARHGAVGGKLSAIADMDFFKVSLSQLQSLSLHSSNVNSQLTIFDQAGNALARSVTTSFGASLPDFVAPSGGDYFIRLNATTAGAYNLLAMTNIVFRPTITGLQGPVTATRSTLLGLAATGLSENYSIVVAAGERLRLETFTPGDAPGQFVNDLDPRLELLSPSGSVISLNDNGADDGRNAVITERLAVGGTYTVRVSASGAAGGAYGVRVSGVAGARPAFSVASATPASGLLLTAPFTKYTMNFTDHVDLASLQASDLLFNGVAATAITIVDGDTVEFTPPTLADGAVTITMAAGAITDIQATPLSAFTSAITLETEGPRLISSSVQKDDLLASGARTFVFEFSRAMSNAFDASDFTLVGGRLGTITGGSISYDATNRRVTISYANLADDAYTLTLISGDGRFEDTLGRDLDGEATAWPIPTNRSGNGTPGGNFIVDFSVDSNDLPLAFTAVKPALSMVSSANSSGGISTLTDSDSFTVTLDADQVLTAIVDAGATLRPTLKVVDGSGTVVATASSTALGKDAYLTTGLLAAGSYKVIVASEAAGSIGGYGLRVLLNAQVEVANHDGPTNGTRAEAQPLDASWTPIGGGVRRNSAVGISSAAGVSDWFSVMLTAGGRYQFAARGPGASMLEIYDEANTLVGSGDPGGRDVNLVMSVDVEVAGRYYLRYAGAAGEYSLLAVENAEIERETNDTRAGAQPLTERPMLGSTQSGRQSALRVGLIQDSLPWGRSSNNMIATELGYTVTLIPSSSLNTVNFSAFDMVVVAGDQTASTYSNVQANMGRIESYVGAGGVWVVNAAGGSNNGFDYDLLPGAAGLSFIRSSGTAIDVLAPSSPLINGPGGTITNSTLDGGNSSYHGFTTGPIPAGGTAILSTATPTQIVALNYGYQSGHVLVNSIPIEYYNAAGNFKVFHANFFNMGAGFVNQIDQDYYSLSLNAGQSYTYRTSTPGDGPGQLDNTLNPALELYDAAGNVVVSDADSAPDGRNAVISFTPTVSGQYFLRLVPTAGSGAYMIATTTVLPPPVAVSGGVDYRLGHGFHISFSEVIDVASVGPADLVVKRVGDATIYTPDRVTISADGLKVSWHFNTPLPNGDYQADLAAGSVVGTRGLAVSNAYRIEGADIFFRAGDADRDRTTNFADLVLLAQHYGQAIGATWDDGDFNFDGAVNFSDLVILAQNYQGASPQEVFNYFSTLNAPGRKPVAEPATLDREREYLFAEEGTSVLQL